MSASFYSHQNPIQDALAVYQAIGYTHALLSCTLMAGQAAGFVKPAFVM